MTNGNASAAGSSARGASEAASAGSDESEQTRPNTRGKGKRNSNASATNGRRKADELAVKPPASKKAKINSVAAPPPLDDLDMDDDGSDDDMKHENGSKIKMTDEEKRKNFLERNR
jgi:ATF/CREB family transcription factor